MNRRQFARSLVALGGSGFGAAVAALPARDHGALHVVRDTRIAALDPRGPAFTAASTRHHVFDGDVTRLWLEVLRDVWRESRAATAGFTRHAEYFVLSTLAREHGYVVAATDERTAYLSWLLLPGRSPER